MNRSGIVLVATLALFPLRLRAQFQNPLQAAKDAYRRAQQQSHPQQQTPQPAKSGAAANASGAATGGGDCCTPEAMKKYAADAAALDIVGIHLGMTPQQAIAAVKAYNPALKIDVIKARIEHPATTPVKVDQIPYLIWAHTMYRNTTEGQIEDITILFTTPPNVPVVAEVQRYIGFRQGEPVLAGNLLESFHKKYGMENYEFGSDMHAWVYGEDGRLLTRIKGPETTCLPTKGLSRVPDPERPETTFNIIVTGDNTGDLERTPACVGYLYATSPGLGNGIAPGRQLHEITTVISSGGLVYGSYHALHMALQAELDGKAKQQQDAAAKRSVPTM